MTLTLHHQGHCGTLWPVINNVHLEHTIADILIYSKINAIITMPLVISSDLDLAAPRSSRHLIVVLLRHVDSNTNGNICRLDV